jgi:hypothetical protein
MRATGWTDKSPSYIAKSAVLLIGCAFCVNTLAANNMPAGCDEISLTPQELDIPVVPLIASKTDHVLVPAAITNDESADQAEVDPQSIAPMLLLTPRVLNILDQVFATDALTPETSDTDTKTTEPASPVADSDDSHSDKKEGVEDNLLLRPQIQSQMYRKDI